MSWSVQAVILGCEMVLGYVLGRVFIPYFRRIKTGKFDFYIGDRFAKDGSEPKFGGVLRTESFQGVCLSLWAEF